jgi:eukaryotic-like serine/threonine-protein kinase
MENSQGLASRPITISVNLYMNEAKWPEVKKHFNLIVELPPEEHNEALSAIGDPEIRAEVEKLVKADIEAKTLPNILGADTAQPRGFEQIGKYRIVRELGYGGMGTVFLAVRDDLQKQFAVKVIKHEFSSSDMLRRFQNETEILARLEHPNIASLIDGDKTVSGLPYFVMEYVEGDDLITYCSSRSVSLEDRLKLFRKICSAVAYAHGKLIVHRDLKPSNILVTAEGEPKLLDFGISKLLTDEPLDGKGTATVLGMMTPNYASPEQFRGESVSTATDVYSLGVILFELLTGELPYEVSNRRLDEVARAVCESEPTKPSSIVAGPRSTGEKATRDNRDGITARRTNPRLLRGDLDNIILKCLRKEPERRYASVEQFSADILRHLEGMPVTARPDTFGYRTSKFLGRNKIAVVSAGLITLALIGGVIGTSWQAVRAQREKKLAEQRYGQVRQLANNILFKYYDEVEKLENSTKVREMLVADSLTYLDSLASDENADDALKSEIARAYIRIGKVQGRAYFANLGDTAGAVENFRKGISMLEPLAAKSDDPKLQSDLINAYSDFSVTLNRQGNAEESGAVLRKAISLNEGLLEKKPGDVALSLRLGTSYVFLGDSLPVGRGEGDNIPAFRRSIEAVDAVLAVDPNHLRAINISAASADRIVTNLLLLAKDAEEDNDAALASNIRREAEPMAKRNIESAGKLLALEPNNVLNQVILDAANFNYGTVLFDSGDNAGAAAYQAPAVEKFKRSVEADVNNLEQKQLYAGVRVGLATTYFRSGKVAEAEPLFQGAIKDFDELVAHDAANFEYAQKRREANYVYADELLLKGNIEKARAFYEKGFAEIEKAALDKNAAFAESLRAYYFEKLGNCDLALAEKPGISPARRRELVQSGAASHQKALQIWKRVGVQPKLGVSQNTRLAVFERKVRREQESLSASR